MNFIKKCDWAGLEVSCTYVQKQASLMIHNVLWDHHHPSSMYAGGMTQYIRGNNFEIFSVLGGQRVELNISSHGKPKQFQTFPENEFTSETVTKCLKDSNVPKEYHHLFSTVMGSKKSPSGISEVLQKSGHRVGDDSKD